MTAQESLLPCPFCGGASEPSYNDFYRDMSMVRCKRCGASAYKTKWNLRHPVARTPLNDEQIAGATGCDMDDPVFIIAKGFVKAGERAHGITQEKQG